MIQAFRARRVIGHTHGGHLVPAQRLRSQVGNQGAVHPAGKTDDHALEVPEPNDLVANEFDQPPASQRPVNRQGASAIAAVMGRRVRAAALDAGAGPAPF